jgi:site-specific recombinase XerC
MNIEGFLISLNTQTDSVETHRAYRQDLERFERFLVLKGLRVTQVKPSTIAEYNQHLLDERGRSFAPATVARRLAVLSSFFDFLGANAEGKIGNPVKGIKRPKVDNDLPRALDDHVLAKLVDGITDVRDRAIVVLFLYSGLRLSELRQLNKDSIVPRKRKEADGTVQYFGTGEVIGKGRKKRVFMVGPAALEALGGYIRAARANDSEPALFVSAHHKRISARNIQDVLDRWCKRLEIPHAHVHQLRHSFATRNVNAGMSAAVLQELMGHSTQNTLQRYFRVKQDRLSREYFATMEFIRQTSPI